MPFRNWVRRLYQEARESERLAMESSVCRSNEWRQQANAQESSYSREKLEHKWPYLVKHMYLEARCPCSDWWSEYLECIVRMNLLRFIVSLSC